MELQPDMFLKRCLDLFFAATLLLLLLPLLSGVWLLVRWKLGKPVFFRQVRPGLNERPFTLYKFRTMSMDRDNDGNLLPDGARLTSLGRILRNTSLDELPELFNVLKGDMSLVGPRPLYSKYLPWYSQRERLRHTIKPGITGWAQINGRNRLPWDQRLAMDVWYVENRSLLLDGKILLKTVSFVLNRHGVSADPDLVENDLDIERCELSTDGTYRGNMIPRGNHDEA
ncbi:undecaprenyl-phosphate glycosylphosphotransferase [Syntrophotalea carbinolica DSM 2380]|uniref:Undecaprenyl-phosphate glycosylphosphotransferase n=1 Tax=Syntrophotalea carbinolica (strain DSM 2380 / NBRC 103641 / GraBd1) TaxID=338963 RepID=Q3A4D2_SYNC1|nr:sugar transferase [Syntrophotalea carbinolica]ABA88775.1 undecaprenyl-phosphate glycosylphosphotransferase [Syntrophotalea carbinolica DSM 2380]